MTAINYSHNNLVLCHTLENNQFSICWYQAKTLILLFPFQSGNASTASSLIHLV